MGMQPQFNIFCGEGGPRNFIQTLAPTASEIYHIDFEGGEGGGIKFSTADERAGALSGSTFKEAHTWGKYPNASMSDKADVWGDYTTTFPVAYAYVLEKAGVHSLRRIFKQRDEYYDKFMDMVKANEPSRQKGHEELLAKLPAIQDAEMAARQKVLGGRA